MGPHDDSDDLKVFDCEVCEYNDSKDDSTR